PPPVHWVGDGFRVHNFIPGVGPLSMERMSPFLLLDYNSPHYFPPTEKPGGVGVHPHRGFETVSIAYSGRIAHHDSFGNSGVRGEGDVQWMTASSGLLHKEYHEKEFARKGGVFHMVQLWVNLPAKDKMSPPKYQPVTNDEMGRFLLPDNGGVIEVISGQYREVKGPATTFSPVALMNAKLNKGGKASFSFLAGHNTGAVVIEGSILLNGTEKAEKDHFVLFRNDGEEFTIEAAENSVILLLSGEPIREPIAAHGPFVMNTRDEIMQAYEDINSGKFGYLED
ncbi:MAG: pirin family protein, partial [Bacteroidales bacterium]|nr:pirin family protein [Bacteroidales bacterium]